MLLKPKWYREISVHYVRPPKHKIRQLELLRKRYSLPHDQFAIGVTSGRWAVLKTQEATLQELLRLEPDLDERELWRRVILSRLELKVLIQDDVWDSQEQLLEQIDNLDQIMKGLPTWTAVLDYVLSLESKRLSADPGILNEIDALLFADEKS